MLTYLLYSRWSTPVTENDCLTFQQQLSVEVAQCEMQWPSLLHELPKKISEVWINCLQLVKKKGAGGKAGHLAIEFRQSLVEGLCSFYAIPILFQA